MKTSARPVVVIDFETRSAANLKNVGPSRYAIDRSTRVLCLGYCIDDGPVRVWSPGDRFPGDLRAAITAGAVVSAHNAGFERAIWSAIMIPKHGAPEIQFDQWDCTSARASAIGLPGALDAVANILGLKFRKDDAGKKIMLKLSRPRKPSKKDPSKWHKDPDDFERLKTYCARDVEVERELHETIPELSETERALWLLDQGANARGIHIDRESVERIIDRIGEIEREIVPRLSRITRGVVTSPNQRDRILDYCAEQGFPLPDLTAATVETALKRDDVPGRVRRVLSIREFLGGAAVKKYKKILANIGPDDRVRDTLIFCGAQRTGRWSGARVQTQNLFRSEISDPGIIESAFRAIKAKDWSFLDLVYGDELTAFASLIRSIFTATPGRRLFVADFSAVETCFLFWIADDVDALETLRSGRDIYRTEAASAYSIEYDTIAKDSPERQFGKKLILGLGYGMGDDKFLKQCTEEGLDLDPEFVRRAVRNYRENHSPVVKLWAAVETAFRSVLTTGRPATIAGGRLTFRRSGRYITIELPSGRRLYYWTPKIRTERKTIRRKRRVVDPRTGKEKTISEPVEREVEVIYLKGVSRTARKWEWITTYGSKIVENIVQASCRDLMAGGMIRVEKKNYEILWTAHDEIISEHESGDLIEYCREMSTLPLWGIGIPLKAAGWTAERYRK